jgi:hypothetical protein
MRAMITSHVLRRNKQACILSEFLYPNSAASLIRVDDLRDGLARITHIYLKERIMTTGNRKVDLNLEEKLAQLNISPIDRARALSAMKAAEDMVDFFGALRMAFKRIAGAFSLRPSVRT